MDLRSDFENENAGKEPKEWEFDFIVSLVWCLSRYLGRHKGQDLPLVCEFKGREGDVGPRIQYNS
jgi:hypothetical protein